MLWITIIRKENWDSMVAAPGVLLRDIRNCNQIVFS
jgi:hypothetical protein